MLTPKSFDIYLNYICPKCGAIHEATPDQTKFPGGVLCYCKEKLKFKKIQNVKVRLEFKEQERAQPIKATKDSPKPKSANDLERKLAISGLVKLGWSRSDAKALVGTLEGTAEEIIQKALRR